MRRERALVAGPRAVRVTRARRAIPLPILVLAAGLALYLSTMAPTLLWGDDAELQRIVVTGEARTIGQSSRASHLLWLALASWFVPATAWLPLDAAGRANLVSALCGAVTLPLVYLAAQELARAFGAPVWYGRAAGVAAAGALGLSHTFWLLAVRPAVYTLEMALLALATWAVLRWRRTGKEVVFLAIAAVAAALALTNHVMILASAPGLAALAIGVPATSRRRLYGAAGVAASLLVAALAVAAAGGVPLDDLGRTVLSYRPRIPLPRDALLVAGYLAYQFPLTLPLAAAGGAVAWRRDGRLLIGLALLYAGNVLLAVTMNVRDQFIFYLLSYLSVALLIGVGAAELLAGRRPRAGWATNDERGSTGTDPERSEAVGTKDEGNLKRTPMHADDERRTTEQSPRHRADRGSAFEGSSPGGRRPASRPVGAAVSTAQALLDFLGGGRCPPSRPPPAGGRSQMGVVPSAEGRSQTQVVPASGGRSWAEEPVPPARAMPLPPPLGEGRGGGHPPPVKCSWLESAGRLIGRPAVLAALVAAPLVVYPLAAAAGGALAARLAPARPLPGRDPIAFYLWPSKAGYTGARAYARMAMESLEPGALVVADWLPYQTLRYVQAVEGARPDVRLELINAGGGAQLRFLLEQRGRRPLYLADRSPYPYYEIDDIERCFAVVRQGVLYRLEPRLQPGGGSPPGCDG